MMVRRLLVTAALVCFAVSGPVLGDTFYLKSGVRIDGVVTQRKGGIIKVRTGSRRVALRESEIARIERNDRTGAFDKEKARAEFAKRDAELIELTGLTAKQRSEVKRLMWRLQSSDPRVSTEAEKKLVAMGREVDLFKFFDYYLPSLSPRFVGKVLKIMCELDPAQACTRLREHSTDADAGSRAAALELMGRVGDEGGVVLLARGLIDPDPDVRIAAAYALAALRVKAASPMLIANLRYPNRRVHNAGRNALRVIWDRHPAVEDFDLPEEWERFWKEYGSRQVPEPFTAESLTPLVAPGEVWEDE